MLWSLSWLSSMLLLECSLEFLQPGLECISAYKTDKSGENAVAHDVMSLWKEWHLEIHLFYRIPLRKVCTLCVKLFIRSRFNFNTPTCWLTFCIVAVVLSGICYFVYPPPLRNSYLDTLYIFPLLFSEGLQWFYTVLSCWSQITIKSLYENLTFPTNNTSIYTCILDLSWCRFMLFSGIFITFYFSLNIFKCSHFVFIYKTCFYFWFQHTYTPCPALI